MDMLGGILMDSMGLSVGQRNLEGRMSLVLYGKRIVCQIHGLRDRKRGR